MTRGGEHFQTLRTMYKLASWRRFRAKHRSNRWADLLGFGPDGTHVIGFWDGSDNLERFDPDDLSWSSFSAYV